MKIAPYVEKLSLSVEFKDFQKKNTDAFMVAGFFILDLESGQNLHQIDYYVPSKKKIAAFTLDKQISIQILDLLNSKPPEKLDMKTKIDLDAIHGLLEDEMKNRNITAEIKKIVAVIQNVDGKKIWSLNCILSGMGILNAHVEDDSMTILKMEKKSFLDLIQKMPPSMLKEQIANQPKIEEGDIENRIKKLEELGDAIKKEKEELEKKTSPKDSSKITSETPSKASVKQKNVSSSKKK